MRARRLLAATTALFAVVFVSPASPAATRSSAATPSPAQRWQADWIVSLQERTGSDAGLIPQDESHTYTNPYFSNLAASGLAAAAAASGDARYADAAWSWLAWYATHMTPEGFVADYRYDPAVHRWVSMGSFDSTDSYAATFITAVRDTFDASRNAAALAALWPAVRKAADAIEVTTDQIDGLTYARPGYGIKLLMDNAEVYHGWIAAAELARAAGDASLESHASFRASQIATSLPTMWDANSPSYAIGRSETGALVKPQWSELYPTAVAQAWMINTGLVPPSRAKLLLHFIELYHPEWEQPDTPDTPSVTTINVSTNAPQRVSVRWWPQVASAYEAVGLTDRAAVAYAKMEAASFAAGPYAFHTEDAGNMLAATLADPGVSFDAKPGAWAGASATLTFSRTGAAVASPGAGLECAVGDGDFAACASPLAFEGMTDGASYVVRVRPVGARADHPAIAASWTVDTVLPSASVDALRPAADQPGVWYLTASNPLAGFVSDNRSGVARVEVTFDSGPVGTVVRTYPMSCAAERQCRWSALAPGRGVYHVTVRAVDAAGNQRILPPLVLVVA